FFTAPATPPTSTLSLHDALPIWLRAAEPGLSLIAPDLQLQVPVRFLTAEWSTGAGSAPAYPAEAVQAFRDALDVLVTVRPVTRTDRKSTRLNSSHVASSYAGFCL